MIALTDEQRVSIAAGATALENHTFDCCLPDEIHTRQISYVATMRDILRTAEDAPREDAPSEAETEGRAGVPTQWEAAHTSEWMGSRSAHLQASTEHGPIDLFYVHHADRPKASRVHIETSSEMAEIHPDNLAALIVGLQELQQHIEAEDVK